MTIAAGKLPRRSVNKAMARGNRKIGFGVGCPGSEVGLVFSQRITAMIMR
jgi:hypothetical protein